MPVDPDKDTAEFRLPPMPVSTSLPQPVSSLVQVDLGALSHPGKVRPNNEDFYLVARISRVLQKLLTNLPEDNLPDWFDEVGYGMVVADGVGGAAAGEVAGRLAISSLVGLVLNTSDWIMRLDERESERLTRRIAERYRQIDATLCAKAKTDPQLAGMGTTLTLAYNLGPDLFLGHVGDSRAYLCQSESFHQLTRDHTRAQELANAGAIQPEEVRTHQFRNILTRALGGSGGRGEPDVQRVRLSDGDQVLLCTDGLTEMVENADIEAILRSGATAQAACQALVDLALDRGGKDNITVVLARYRFAPGT